jgi:DNA-binding NarL/FixJ family response regulator
MITIDRKPRSQSTGLSDHDPTESVITIDRNAQLVVVRLIEDGHTRPEVAELCGISLSSVGRYVRRYRATGSVSPDQFGGY